MTESLKEEFLKEGAPKVVHEEQEVAAQAAASTGYTAEDEAEIARRLADLGYIE